MATVEAELWELKERALAASARNDRDFYASYLAEDARAVLPSGVLERSAILAGMSGERASFAAERVEDTVIQPLGDDAGIVTYRAVYRTGGRESTVIATTVYRRRAGRWQGVLYQQTPVP